MKTQHPEASNDAWKEEIPRIAEGNGFDSDELFYCKFGMYFFLETEEQYRRAQRIVATFPYHRIFRYAGHAYTPGLYKTFGPNVDCYEYVKTGKEELFPQKRKED